MKLIVIIIIIIIITFLLFCLLCLRQQPPPPSPPDDGDGESDDDNDDDDDDDNRNLMPKQWFLFDQPQRTALAVGTNNAAMSVSLQEKKLDFLKTLVKSFLKQTIYLNRTINQKY